MKRVISGMVVALLFFGIGNHFIVARSFDIPQARGVDGQFVEDGQTPTASLAQSASTSFFGWQPVELAVALLCLVGAAGPILYFGLILRQTRLIAGSAGEASAQDESDGPATLPLSASPRSVDSASVRERAA